jgi:surface protein
MRRTHPSDATKQCGINLSSDVVCNKESSENRAVCTLNTVSNRCTFAKSPVTHKKYTFRDVKSMLSTSVPARPDSSPLHRPPPPRPHSHLQQSQPPPPPPISNRPAMNNQTIRIAVSEWKANPNAARDRHGDISAWNTTYVTDMSGLFRGIAYRDPFNDELGDWDTRNVTTMCGMFASSSAFNQPLSNWNTSNVVDMSYMFWDAGQFDQPLNNWDTRNVVNMSHMFARASNFNQKLDTWGTRNVRDMSYMFSRTNKFNQKLETWDTRNVVTMEGMFLHSSRFNKPLDKWNTSNVRSTRSMFYLASKFDKPLNSWDTSNVTNMSGMFMISEFNQPLNRWVTSNVQNMSQMFAGSEHFNQPLSSWDTSNVQTMSQMFSSAHPFNQDISNWKTSQVVDMRYMFNNTASFNQPLNNWNTSNVKVMANMFSHARQFNQPLNNWNTGNVTHMSEMFKHASRFNQPLGNWNTSRVVDMRQMFFATSLFDHPLHKWDLRNVRSRSLMFEQAPLMRRRYPDGRITTARDRTDALWNKVRGDVMGVERNGRLRFKWQELCDVNSKVSIDVLRRLASDAKIQSPATKTKRELCADFSRLWSAQAVDMSTALPGCTNETGLMQYPVADTPPEFFYRYTHDGTVYCDDIRHLYEHLKTSSKNPYTNLPFSPAIIRDIQASYTQLKSITTSMADFDDGETDEAVPFSSRLSQKLADLMSKLHYPNDLELFRGASDVQFSVFVQSLHQVGVISSNDGTRVESQRTLAEQKALLVDLLLLKIDQDPNRQETTHGTLSRVAIEVSNVYNDIFI